MDGIGIAPENEGNAIFKASTPTLDMLFDKYPWVKLKAHGTAVGLPSDEDMGNSEVGHNALGAGQVFAQGCKLVTNSIESGAIFLSDTWKTALKGKTLHFIGLLSDANVHSNLDHLYTMIRQAKEEGVKKVRVHVLLDGRDVPPMSGVMYVEMFEKFLAGLNSADFNARIASGGGRMMITMDRYEADWKMVERGWHIHVLGDGRLFKSAAEAIETIRNETGNDNDQFLSPFVIAEDGKPVGTIDDGDSVIFYNFRGDRAIEISKAFEDENFTYFDRVKRPKVFYAGMLEYDGDLHIPSNYLVNPPEISNTMGERLATAGIHQLAISETQKYGHVTYFWNGNRSGKFSDELETYIEIPSDIVPFEQRPWMKCAEITDKLIECLRSGKYQFLRCNFPNGDMVGHTGNFEAARISIEALDLQLARILPVVDEIGAVAIITADHGNADEMYELDKKMKLPTKQSKTAHTLNPVPCIIYDNFNDGLYTVNLDGDFGLSNVAATTLNLLGYTAPEIWDESIIKLTDIY